MEYEIDPDEAVSAAVVRAVSAVEGRAPRTLPLLADVLHPDALDSLFAPRFDGAARSGGRLSFIYSTCRVTVENGEYLTVQPLPSRPQRVSGRQVGSDR